MSHHKKIIKLPIIKKLWEVYLKDDFDFYIKGDGEFHFAKTAGQAKNKYGGTRYKNFINIKAVRAYNGDIVLWNSIEVRRGDILALERNKKLKESIISLPDSEEFYIQDTRSYHGNAIVWWAKDSNGYTSNIEKAQRYTKKDILIRFASPRESDVIWPCKHIDKVIPIKIIDGQYIDRDLSL